MVFDRNQYRRENQSSCQVVRNRGDEERQQTRNPEQFLIIVSLADQVCFQFLKNIPFDQCFDIGHRDIEEEENCRNLDDQVVDCLMQAFGDLAVNKMINPPEEIYPSRQKVRAYFC